MPEGRPEEDYDLWLDRLMDEAAGENAISIEQAVSVDILRGFLEQRSLVRGDEATRESATQSLWNALERNFSLRQVGIVPYLFRFTTGTQVRFGIRGQRGAFGSDFASSWYGMLTGRNWPFTSKR